MFSPWVNITFQATTLSALSNIFAQCLQAYGKRSSFAIDFAQLFHFALLSLLVTPPNYAFQKFLESSFPTTAISEPKNPSSNSKEAAASNAKESLCIGNTIAKFLLDQSIGASINTLVFIAAMGMFRGLTTSDILVLMKQDFWPMLSAGYKVWPLVCLLNLVVVPFEYRMLVGNGVAFGWGVYMSLYSF